MRYLQATGTLAPGFSGARISPRRGKKKREGEEEVEFTLYSKEDQCVFLLQ